MLKDEVLMLSFLWWMYFSVLFMFMSNEFHGLWKLGHCEHGVGREISDWWELVISFLDTNFDIDFDSCSWILS